ncbi:MAG: UDP-N-acetylmuramoyl-tripeptide--D-alanyl-D-alanine ligase [Lachnospiraceae bacterium]
MKNLTLENIAKVCGGTYIGDSRLCGQEIGGISTDSRKTGPGELFIPIVGARVDAHDYIAQVMEQGALATLSERTLEGFEGTYILVDSSLEAIKKIAAFYLEQLAIPVVGITGSVGKTSTKELVASVLQTKFKTLKTQGNFNNELGVPLTIFRLGVEDEIAVLEMGISDFGEMSRLGAITRPDSCVITNIGPCHLENLKDLDGVFKAKTEIFAYLAEHGTVFLNGDDNRLAAVTQVKGSAPVFFGMGAQNTIYATEIVENQASSISCRIHTQDTAFDVVIPMPGRHMVYNALAATAVGLHYGLTIEFIKAGIEQAVPLAGRFRQIQTSAITMIDDCYNANPVSMKASLEVLSKAAGRKVALLGDMGELGADEIRLHEEVGAYAAGLALDVCIGVGVRSRALIEEIRTHNTKMALYSFASLAEVSQELAAILQPGDTVLIKASHFMDFGQLVAQLEAMTTAELSNVQAESGGGL